MSTTDALESHEDLENVRLVRMEDVQPARDRNCSEVYSIQQKLDSEVYETCIVDSIDYENECILKEDEDSNIGSMVSIQSEEVVGFEDTDGELIVPEVVPTPDVVLNEKEPVTVPTESWPTLEILPGGVIRHAEKCIDSHDIIHCDILESDGKVGDAGDDDDDLKEMYACAKCPRSFKYLVCLVKHVKWHEEQKRKDSKLKSNKSSSVEFHITRKRQNTNRLQLVYEGNRYLKDNTNKGNRVMWHCSKKSVGCQASLTTLNGIVIKTKNRHNHNHIN